MFDLLVPFLYFVAAIGLILVLFMTIIFFFFPHYIIKFFFGARQFHAGMKIKYIGDEDFIICYGERNTMRLDKPSIIFVHGFTSSKDQWITCFRNLPSDLHMIAIDMPGHGGSSFPKEEQTLDVPFVVEKLRKFLDLLGLSENKVHLVGSSLGGAIVGVFAAHYPEQVAKVSMICPAMETPIMSNLVAGVKEAVITKQGNMSVSDCPLLPQSVSDLRNLLEIVCYNRFVLKAHDQILKGFLDLRLPKTEYFLKVFKIITKKEHFDLLPQLAPKITVPSQLIWGKQDEIVHVSGVEVLQAKLPDCRRVDIIDKCGHAVDFDRPGALTKALLAFIREPVDSSDKKME